MNDKWVEFAIRIQSIAQAGLQYGKDKSGYAFCIKKCYFSSATVRNQRNIMIIGGSNHEISLS